MSTAMEAVTHMFEITTSDRKALQVVRATLDYHRVRFASPSPKNAQDIRNLVADLRDLTGMLDDLDAGFQQQLNERDALNEEFAPTPGFAFDPYPASPVREVVR